MDTDKKERTSGSGSSWCVDGLSYCPSYLCSSVSICGESCMCLHSRREFLGGRGRGDLAVLQVDLALAVAGDGEVVRHDEDRVALGVEVLEEGQDFLAR